MNPEILKSMLTELRLATAARELEEVLTNQKKAVSLGWAGELLEREVDARRDKSLKRRLKSARFPEITTLEAFDFSFNLALGLGAWNADTGRHQDCFAHILRA